MDKRRREPHIPHILGVLNLTPDSFSDGGKFCTEKGEIDVLSAINASIEMFEHGAYAIDIGGDSTRPGSKRVDIGIEQLRIMTVVRELKQRGVRLSIDTQNEPTARLALEAPGGGEVIINDISGGKADPNMLPLIADFGCRYILGHWRADSSIMQNFCRYENPIKEVQAEILQSVQLALDAGIRKEQIILDFCLGFAKDNATNWALLQGIDEFLHLGFDLLVSASRKRFLQEVVRSVCGDFAELPIDRLDLATAVLTALCAQKGVWGVRVHSVADSAIALSVVNGFVDSDLYCKPRTMHRNNITGI